MSYGATGSRVKRNVVCQSAKVIRLGQTTTLLPRVLSLFHEVESGPWERGWTGQCCETNQHLPWHFSESI